MRLILLLTVLVAGCGLVPVAEPGDGTEGGPGLPAQRPDLPIAGQRQPIVGAVAMLPNGCLHAALDDGRVLFVIWPAGSAMSESGDAIVIGDHGLRDGEAFQAIGAVVPVDALPDPGYWREAHLLFCDPDATEVVVIDAIA